jgi:hypothetical protein
MKSRQRWLLVAAAASPLEERSDGWYRSDAPLGVRVVSRDVGELLKHGYLDEAGDPGGRLSATPTEDGLAEAEAARAMLGELLPVLRRIGEAGELVRRERERDVEWLRPRRRPPDPHDWQLSHVCYHSTMEQLEACGLVVLVDHGRRALLTGAGSWCAAEEP